MKGVTIMKNTEKLEYEAPETELVALETEDVIGTSTGGFDIEDDEFF